MKIVPSEIPQKILHSYLIGSIGPRPICFASTVDKAGNQNLSPYSFFNMFGSNPPIVIFSPTMRSKDSSIKNTLENIIETREVVINVVNYNIVNQMSLTSCEYPKNINEFSKGGFTKVKAEFVKPYLVKECPVQIECKVLDIVKTGEKGGAANLVICEVLCIHIDDGVISETGQIDPNKIDLVGRMGGDYYCRTSGASLFTVPRPNYSLAIGLDQLPLEIRNSKVLSGNDLGILANLSKIPAKEEIINDEFLIVILNKECSTSVKNLELHMYAKIAIESNQIEKAWQILLQCRK